MILKRCVWHRYYNGYSLICGVSSWGGVPVAYHDVVCRGCLRRLVHRPAHHRLPLAVALTLCATILLSARLLGTDDVTLAARVAPPRVAEPAPAVVTEVAAPTIARPTPAVTKIIRYPHHFTDGIRARFTRVLARRVPGASVGAVPERGNRPVPATEPAVRRAAQSSSVIQAP